MADVNSREANDAALAVDADNTAWMRSVLDRCGWPKRSLVGEDGATSAWLLVQHADMQPEFQVTAAREMKYAVFAGEADGWRLALLVDRNRRETNLPTVYGVGYYRAPGGEIVFSDIVNPLQLDERRHRIGLPPFYCEAMRASQDNGNAPLRWPAGVLLQPTECDLPSKPAAEN